MWDWEETKWRAKCILGASKFGISYERKQFFTNGLKHEGQTKRDRGSTYQGICYGDKLIGGIEY